MKSPRTLAVWIVMGLMIIGLMGFGTQSFSGRINRLGTVGDMDLPLRDYSVTLQRQIEGYEAQLGREVAPQELQSQVLSGLITRRVIENEAAQQGLSIGDAALTRAITDSSTFAALNGSFDRDAYRETLRRSGLSEEEYETALRETEAGGLLRDAVIAGTPRTGAYIDAMMGFALETRDVTFAPITTPSTPLADPSDAELRGFYDSETDLFFAPETRQVEAALITPAMLIDSVDLDESALRALYDERADQYALPARRLVERLVFGDDAQAQAAALRLAEGTSFEDLVAARGLDLSAIDLGDVEIADLGAAGEAVFAAAQGDVVGPLPSRVGPALYRVNGILEAQTTPYAEALPELREELAAARAIRLIDDQRDQIEDLIAGGATIDDLTQRTQMQARSATWSAASEDPLFAYDSVMDAMAQLQPGDLPKLVVLEDGGLMALSLREIVPATRRSFEDAKSEIATAWRAAQTVIAARDTATAHAQSLRDGGTFAELGLTPQTETGFTRGSFLPTLPADAVIAAFDAAVGDVITVDTEAGAMILRVDAQGTSEDTDGLRDEATQGLQDELSGEILSAFLAAVQQRTDITIDQAALNAVHAQLQ